MEVGSRIPLDRLLRRDILLPHQRFQVNFEPLSTRVCAVAAAGGGPLLLVPQQLHGPAEGAGQAAGLELRLRRQPEPLAACRHAGGDSQPPIRHRNPHQVNFLGNNVFVVRFNLSWMARQQAFPAANKAPPSSPGERVWQCRFARSKRSQQGRRLKNDSFDWKHLDDLATVFESAAPGDVI